LEGIIDASLSGLDDGMPVIVGMLLDDGDSDLRELGAIDGNALGLMLMLGASDGTVDPVLLGPSLGLLELAGPVLRVGNSVGRDVGIPVMLGLLLVVGIEVGLSEALALGDTVTVGIELGLLLGCLEYTSSNRYSSTDAQTSCTSLDPSSKVNLSSSVKVITLSSVQSMSPCTAQVAFQNVCASLASVVASNVSPSAVNRPFDISSTKLKNAPSVMTPFNNVDDDADDDDDEATTLSSLSMHL